MLTFCRCRLKYMLELAGVPRYVGTGPSHVDRDQWTSQVGIVARFGVPNDSTGRTTEDGS